jgi:hypothetical protein
MFVVRLLTNTITSGVGNTTVYIVTDEQGVVDRIVIPTAGSNPHVGVAILGAYLPANATVRFGTPMPGVMRLTESNLLWWKL